MRYFILLAFCFSIIFAHQIFSAIITKTGAIQVNDHWYCIYCGFKNKDKDSQCKNWQCPTNKSIE